MKSLAIIGISILAAVIYGIIHDQITARICLEYFTIGHAPLIDSDSPTVHGFYWGVIATWWVGLPLGLGLAMAARVGKRPQLDPSQLIRPIGKLLLFMFTIAILAGLVGFFTSRNGVFHLVSPMAKSVPADKHVAFLTAAWAHSASYLAGLVGGIVLWILTWKRRGKL